VQEQEAVTARGIAEAMQAMSCRAVGIAAQDLAGGIDLLKEIQDKQKLNWLSMNLVDSTTNQTIFAPSVDTRIGSINITILGLTDERAGPGKDAGYTILPWQEVLPEVVANVDTRADMIILLSSYPDTINKEITRTVQGIDLILESAHGASNQPPRKVEDTLLARVGAQGKYVGMMRINWTDAGQWGQNFSEQIRAEQNRLDRITWQIGRMEKRDQEKDLKIDGRYQRLLVTKEKSVQKIKQLKETRAHATGEPCSFTNRFIGLKSSMPEDREIQAIIDQTTREVNRLNRKRIRNTNTQQHFSIDTLAGWQKCQECHPKQTAFWQTTDHSRSLKTLEQAEQQFNEDCLLCHVTLPYYDAARVKSEKLLIQLPQSLKNVGCESCHGPAAAHSRQPESIRLVNPDQKVCTGCHTPDHDDNFIFADKIRKVRCPKGITTSGNSRILNRE
jgi:predicted CXXCH cytochrome family protein